MMDADHLNTFLDLRGLLFSIAYRMVGSAVEAEDLVQDAQLRWLKLDPRSVRDAKSLLSTMITRLSINHLSSARVRRETYLGPWLPEPVLSAGRDEFSNPSKQVGRQESISLAFLMLLENLTAAERAVFLLREVFDYDYAEIAETLDKSEPACRKLNSRARAQIRAGQPKFSARPEEHEAILSRFTQAVAAGDVDEFVELLADEVTFWADGGGKARGAATQPVQGRAAVAQFVLASVRFTPEQAQFEFSELNGYPGLIIRDLEGQARLAVTLEIDAGRIRNIYAVANPEKLSGLGS